MRSSPGILRKLDKPKDLMLDTKHILKKGKTLKTGTVAPTKCQYQAAASKPKWWSFVKWFLTKRK